MGQASASRPSVRSTLHSSPLRPCSVHASPYPFHHRPLWEVSASSRGRDRSHPHENFFCLPILTQSNISVLYEDCSGSRANGGRHAQYLHWKEVEHSDTPELRTGGACLTQNWRIFNQGDIASECSLYIGGQRVRSLCGAEFMSISSSQGTMNHHNLLFFHASVTELVYKADL